jgi:hypothetical protein
VTIPATWDTIALDELHPLAVKLKGEGYRFVQTHAVNTDAGIDLYYTFMKDGVLHNYKVAHVTPDQQVPSMTDQFLSAFVFENEARELFGVDMRDIAIDFGGRMYDVSEKAPMTYVSPVQKREIDKARRAALAKEQKLRKAQVAQAAFNVEHPQPQEKGAVIDPKAMGTRSTVGDAMNESLMGAAKTAARRDAGAFSSEFAMRDEKAEAQAALEKKLAGMPPEKAARVRAAMAAKAAREAKAAGAQASEKPLDPAIAEKIKNLPPDKAAKVRAALEAKAAREGAAKGGADAAAQKGAE